MGTTDATDVLVFERSRTLMPGTLILTGLSLVILYFCIAEYPGFATKTNILSWLGFGVGMFALLVFLPLSIAGIRRLFSSQPYLRIALDGLHFQLLARRIFVPWEEVADITLTEGPQGPMILVLVRNPDEFVARNGLLYRLLHGKGSEGGSLRIHQNLHDCNLAEILFVLESGLEAAEEARLGKRK